MSFREARYRITLFFNMYPLHKNHEPQEIGKYIEPLISGHSKWRIPLISGQNIFPQLFSSQILIKKSRQKANTQLADTSIQRTKMFARNGQNPIFFPPIG